MLYEVITPIATTFLFQNFFRRPVTKRIVRGSASAGPSRFAISVAVASSSLMYSYNFV